MKTEQIKTCALISLALGATSVTLGCADAESQPFTSQSYDLTTPDDATPFEVDREVFEARRQRYERDGVQPDVPASLSSDARDPEFVFLGYRALATPDEEAADDARHARRLAEPIGDEERASLEEEHEPLDELTFVHFSGETWAYRPSDPERLRRELGDGSRSEPSELGPPEPGDELAADETSVEKAVLGSDHRQLRSGESGHDMTAYPWRTFGPLVPNGLSQQALPTPTCSATKIGQRHLLTAAHCVFTAGGGKGSLKLRDWWPGADGLDQAMNGGDGSPNGSKNIQWYVYSKKFVNDGWYSRDYAVLVLFDNQNSCNLGWLGYRVDNSLAGSNMWNFGYPGFNQDCQASTRPDGRCGGSLYGMNAKITRTEVPYIFYKHDTQGGQSGSAVYDYNGGQRQLVGIVQGGYSALENRGIKIRKLVFDFIGAARNKYPSSHCD